MIDGADLSRYDSAYQDDTTAVDDPRVQFVILNCDDPGVSAKAHRAVELGKPWGLYTWLYAGHGAESTIRGQAVADLLELDGLTQPPLGIWIDYEDNGVTPDDAWAAWGAQGHVKTKLGFYTYLYELNGQEGLRAVWDAFHPGTWLAYYPGANDGSYPAYAVGDAQANRAMLWQYTSTNGSRDRDSVVDEVAWARWADAPAPAPPPAQTLGGDMDLYVGQITKEGVSIPTPEGAAPVPAHTPLGFLVAPGGRIIQTWAGPGPGYGGVIIPQGAADWLSHGRSKVDVIPLDPPQMLAIVDVDTHSRK